MDDWDLNLLRIAVTLISLALFLALVLHSWSRRRVPEHAEAALLPFADETAAGGAEPRLPDRPAGGHPGAAGFRGGSA